MATAISGNFDLFIDGDPSSQLNLIICGGGVNRFNYEASSGTIPQFQEWIVHSGASNPPTPTIVDDTLLIDTTSDNLLNLNWDVIDLGCLDFGTDYFYAEILLKIQSANRVLIDFNDHWRTGFEFHISDINQRGFNFGVHALGLEFSNDIGLPDSSNDLIDSIPSVSEDIDTTSDFNLYAIEVSGGTGTFYMNGLVIGSLPSGAISSNGTTSNVSWGDRTSFAKGEYDIKWVRTTALSLVALSGSTNLFIESRAETSGQTDLFIEGHEVSSGNVDLFTRGFDESSGSMDLFIETTEPISGSIDLHISGSIKTPIGSSGDIDLIIQGIGPTTTVDCPVVSTSGSIVITSDLIDIYQGRIDALINQIGKNMILVFDATRDVCPNCEFDPIRNRSSGRPKPGGPRPFIRGRRCPYCKGLGFIETENQKCIKALTRWNPTDAIQYGISIRRSRDLVRFKTFTTDYDDLIRARYAIANHDIASTDRLKVVLKQTPVVTGLRESRYCISFWERV